MAFNAREMVAFALTIEGTDRLSPAARTAQGSIQALAGSARRSSFAMFGLSNAFTHVGGSMQRTGLAILAGAGSVLKFTADFDKSMRQVRTQTDLTNQQFAALEDQVLEMATESERPLAELAEGLFDIFSSTFVNAKQATDMLEQFSKGATAGATDIRTVSRAAIAEMNAFGLSTSDLSHILDTQFALVRVGVGTYEEFASVIGMLAPFAVASGQSLESMSAALAFMTRAGLSASEATTSVGRALEFITRGVIQDRLKKTLGVDVVDEATGKFKQINEIITEMATTGGLAKLSEPDRRRVLEDIFGQGEIRANRFFNVAIPRFEELNKVFREVAGPKAAGAMLRAFRQMSRSPSVQWAKLLNTLRAFAVEIGTAFVPMMQEAIKVVQDLLETWKELPDSTKETIARLTALAGVFLTVGGTMLKFIGNMLAVVSIVSFAGPSFTVLTLALLGVLGAITGIGLALFENRGKWEDALDSLASMWDSVKQAAIDAWNDIRPALTSFGEALIALGKAALPVVIGALKILVPLLSALFNILADVARGVANFLEAWGPADELFAGLVIAIGGLKILTKVVGWAKGVKTALLGVATAGGAAAGTAGKGGLLALARAHPVLAAAVAGLTVLLDAESTEKHEAIAVERELNDALKKGLITQTDYQEKLREFAPHFRAFVEVMARAKNPTDDQRLAIFALITELNRLGGHLNMNQTRMIGNLLAVGGFNDALRLLEGAVTGAGNKIVKQGGRVGAGWDKVSEATLIAGQKAKGYMAILEGTDKGVGSLERIGRSFDANAEAVLIAEQKARAYGAMLDALDKNVQTKFEGLGLEAIQNSVAALREQMDYLDRKVFTVDVLLNSSGSVREGGTTPGGGKGGGGGQGGAPPPDTQVQNRMGVTINTKTDAKAEDIVAELEWLRRSRGW